MAKEEAYQILGPQVRGAIDSGCLRPGKKGIGHVHSSAQSAHKCAAHWLRTSCAGADEIATLRQKLAAAEARIQQMGRAEGFMNPVEG
jgi:hypothetical protein